MLGEKDERAATVNQPNPLAFYLALVYVFIIFTQLHELVALAIGVNTFLLPVVTVPTLLVVAFSGGFQRTLRWRAAKYWVAYTAWMILALPFSSWKAGSLMVVITWIRAEVMVLFVIAGCVITWKQVNQLLAMFALAAAVDVIAGRILAGQLAGRLELTGTTMSDPNDYAAQLILVLPFLLLVIMSRWRGSAVRVLAVVALLGGIFLILLTGSRGALMALCVSVGFCLWKLRPSQKMAALLALAALAAVAVFVLPQEVLSRFSTLVRSKDANSNEEALAIGSTEARTYLLRESIYATLTHPLFGVGAGQFESYEGYKARDAGQKGQWHQTHNSFTQVSSENGLPALVFFLAAIIVTYRMLSAIHREAQKRPATSETRRIKATAFCLLASLVGFCAAIFFLSLAYRFYLPALTGITIAFSRGVRHQWRRADAPSLVNEHLEVAP